MTATGAWEVNETSDTVSATTDCTTDITHAPGIEVTKSCPELVAFGAEISYTITVTNTGNEALEGVTVSRHPARRHHGCVRFDDPFPVDGEATAIVTYTPGADEDPVTNTVTATGFGVDSEVQATAAPATCTTDVSNPAIQIVKTVSEEVVPVGTTVTYTFVVTNTGDVTLFDITVDDDIMGHIGDIPELDPGDFVTLTKDFEVGTEPVTNVATAVGEDSLGRVVSDDDDAIVSPIAGENPPNPPGTPFTGADAGRLGLITLGPARDRLERGGSDPEAEAPGCRLAARREGAGRGPDGTAPPLPPNGLTPSDANSSGLGRCCPPVEGATVSAVDHSPRRRAGPGR